MILNIFKAKPTLKELIPDGFVDIHSHILPGIDDGAKNIEESMSLIYEMEKMGFSKIYGTPHIYPGLYDNDINSIKNSFKKLVSRIENKSLIGFACEYMLDDSIFEKIEKKELLTFAENHVLVEQNFMTEIPNIFDKIFKLRINDYTPILAHPERYLFYKNNRNNFNKFKLSGCKFQLNLLSTTGYYGKEVTKMADFLINENLIDFCGSDIHNLRHIKGFKNLKIKIRNIKALEKIIERNTNFT